MTNLGSLIQPVSKQRIFKIDACLKIGIFFRLDSRIVTAQLFDL